MNELDNFLQQYKGSPNTISTYQGIIRRMLNSIGKPISKITGEDIKKYFTSLVNKYGNISNTSMSHQTTLCCFFRYIKRMDLHDSIYHNRRNPNPNPMFHIKMPNIRPLDRTKLVSEEEYRKLLEIIKQMRDRIIVCLLYNSAVRIAELYNIRIKDIDFTEGSIHIWGKGKHGSVRERPTSTMREDFNMIQKYVLDNGLKSEDRLLDITVSAMQKRLHFLCDVAGIRPLHPHMFRHAAITKMFENGMPIEKISAMVGTSVEVLRKRYIHTSSKFVSDAYKEYMDGGKK